MHNFQAVYKYSYVADLPFEVPTCELAPHNGILAPAEATPTMAEFLEEYLRIGLSQIVVIDYRHSEERSGYQNEHTHETIVAYDGKRFVQVETSESRIFAPPGGHECS